MQIKTIVPIKKFFKMFSSSSIFNKSSGYMAEFFIRYKNVAKPDKINKMITVNAC